MSEQVAAFLFAWSIGAALLGCATAYVVTLTPS